MDGGKNSPGKGKKKGAKALPQIQEGDSEEQYVPPPEPAVQEVQVPVDAIAEPDLEQMSQRLPHEVNAFTVAEKRDELQDAALWAEKAAALQLKLQAAAASTNADLADSSPQNLAQTIVKTSIPALS